VSPRFGCADLERFVDAYVDGEFSDEERVDLERHLGECASCAERVRFQAGWKAALRAAAPRPSLPADLRARLAAALDKEPLPRPRWQRVGMRAAVPAAAAALLGMLMWSAHPFSPVVEDAIAKYRRDLPVEVTGGDDQVRAWFANKVDFAVRPPRLPPHSIFRGGRLANVGTREAALLVYDVGGEKVSVLVFDPRNVPLETRRHRYVGNHDVFLDGQRGYNVAFYRDRDVGYAFTSDMDEDRMIQLVSTAVSP
jgi:anti-sigma factor RsiW